METKRGGFMARRVTMVQFGDYAEAIHRFARGGAETFYAQRYSVEFVASLAKKVDSLTVINVSSDSPVEQLSNGVHACGVKLYPTGRRPRHDDLVTAVAQTDPTHVIVKAPIAPLIRWGIGKKLNVLPMFADSFRANGIKASLKHRTLAFLLNNRAIEIVANHGIAASQDLNRIGVNARKIVPFDLPAVIKPDEYAPKTAPDRDRPFRLIYVGGVTSSKGVGDAIKAVSVLRGRGREIQLTVIGRGELDTFKQLAAQEGVEPTVFFLGLRSHADVLAAMRDHDAVIVPSHWAYPEGLPMTLYEALCTRTPLLASNHPMFSVRIRDGYNALVFPERNPTAIADRVEELASSPHLYAALSAAAEESCANYFCPVKFDRLIADFLSETGCRRLIEGFSLANRQYA
jgi:glycosyltransferase involved in cell wall biosynthesis